MQREPSQSRRLSFFIFSMRLIGCIAVDIILIFVNKIPKFFFGVPFGIVLVIIVIDRIKLFHARIDRLIIQCHADSLAEIVFKLFAFKVTRAISAYTSFSESVKRFL